MKREPVIPREAAYNFFTNTVALKLMRQVIHLGKGGEDLRQQRNLLAAKNQRLMGQWFDGDPVTALTRLSHSEPADGVVWETFIKMAIKKGSLKPGR